jgi:alkylation response protein AidB-like acyl-CoA dehydrogenase
MNERVSIGGAIAPRDSGPIGAALQLWRERSDKTSAPAVALRDRLVSLWCEAEVLRLTNIRASENRRVGVPGPEGSTGKLHFAELNKRIYELCVDLMGPTGMLYGSYEMRRPESAMDSQTVSQAFLRSRANSIEGGTSEVMRNILGERVLGLPGDVRNDKVLPWSQVPR